VVVAERRMSSDEKRQVRARRVAPLARLMSAADASHFAVELCDSSNLLLEYSASSVTTRLSGPFIVNLASSIILIFP